MTWFGHRYFHFVGSIHIVFGKVFSNLTYKGSHIYPHSLFAVGDGYFVIGEFKCVVGIFGYKIGKILFHHFFKTVYIKGNLHRNTYSLCERYRNVLYPSENVPFFSVIICRICGFLIINSNPRFIKGQRKCVIIVFKNNILPVTGKFLSDDIYN